MIESCQHRGLKLNIVVIMSNMMKIFGLFFIVSAVSASYNLYLNEQETMRLLGKLMIISLATEHGSKTGNFSWGRQRDVSFTDD